MTHDEALRILDQGAARLEWADFDEALKVLKGDAPLHTPKQRKPR